MSEADWDHIRVFLATLREGSLRAAAENLRISHPTARRQLSVYEQSIGFPLFHRRPDGLHPTVEAKQMRQSAEEVERSVQALGRAADADAPGLQGYLRVTPQTMATDLLARHFTEFTQKWPEVSLELDCSYALADLDRREADVALRGSPTASILSYRRWVPPGIPTPKRCSAQPAPALPACPASLLSPC